MTRDPKPLVQERQQEVTRLHKVRESATVTLGAVASDVLGARGRDRLAALLAGEQDAAARAELARGRVRAKLPALRQPGLGGAHERPAPGAAAPSLGPLLAPLDCLDGQLEPLTAESEAAQIPCADAVAVARLQTSPGVAEAAASAMVAAIGTHRRRFPSAAHRASWAGRCAGKRQRGGKRLSGHSTPGNRWLRAVVGAVAWSAVHTHDTSPVALSHRIARRRGNLRASVAVAHSRWVSIYHLLRTHQPYHDLGPDDREQLDHQRRQRQYVRRLEHLGYAVTLTPTSAA